ncbi:MAG: RsmD family RNA methyltransferase [Rhodothermia bacterium]|nr:MAG: RsmD family RNA methyltransferase [Rhodothermia bacterium]
MRLTVPKGNLIRPTSNRVREAMFNVIASRMDLDGARVLDMFSGTGALGLEAVSRGAEAVTFVDSHPLVLACARDNAESLDVSDRCTFLRMDVRTFLEQHNRNRFDLILADPPYGLETISEIPKFTGRHLQSDGLFVLEHDKRIEFSNDADLSMTKSYGRTHLSIFEYHVNDE